LEESTNAVNRPTMGVFNNLVMFKQDEPQNTPETIVPELATEWRWSEDGTELTFPLHEGVKWHDGKPFTAADVKCTLDLLQGKAGRPYLDGIEYRIIKDVSTRLLSFIAGKEDVYFTVTMPQLKDVKTQLPRAICDMYISNVSRNLLVNRSQPPFDNAELRRAMSLALDRQAFVDIIADGQG